MSGWRVWFVRLMSSGGLSVCRVCRGWLVLGLCGEDLGAVVGG